MQWRRRKLQQNVCFNVASDILAYLWDDVRFFGPFAGIGLVVGPTLVVSPTNISQHK